MGDASREHGVDFDAQRSCLALPMRPNLERHAFQERENDLERGRLPLDAIRFGKGSRGGREPGKESVGGKPESVKRPDARSGERIRTVSAVQIRVQQILQILLLAGAEGWFTE